jgi:hypothetical protein
MEKIRAHDWSKRIRFSLTIIFLYFNIFYSKIKIFPSQETFGNPKPFCKVGERKRVWPDGPPDNSSKQHRYGFAKSVRSARTYFYLLNTERSSTSSPSNISLFEILYPPECFRNTVRQPIVQSYTTWIFPNHILCRRHRVQIQGLVSHLVDR